MNDYLDLIKLALPHLINLDNILYEEFSQNDTNLENLIKEIENVIAEGEILKIGHIARI